MEPYKKVLFSTKKGSAMVTSRRTIFWNCLEPSVLRVCRNHAENSALNFEHVVYDKWEMPYEQMWEVKLQLNIFINWLLESMCSAQINASLMKEIISNKINSPLLLIPFHIFKW